MSTDVLRILYLSKAAYAIDHDELVDMTQHFAAKNIGLGVTGTLLRIGNYFVQVIEGPPETIDPLFAKIETDRRHEGVTVLARYRDNKRVFGDWGMTYVDTDSRYYVSLEATAELRDQVEEFLKTSSFQPRAMLATLARIQSHIRSHAPVSLVNVDE